MSRRESSSRVKHLLHLLTREIKKFFSGKPRDNIALIGQAARSRQTDVHVYACMRVYVYDAFSLVMEAGLVFLGDFRTRDNSLVREALDKGVSDD